MKTTLLKLILSNFREISGTFEFGPERNVWSGPNGSGKTTIADAEKWLREGTDSQGNAKFGIKTIRDGKQLTHTDHSAFAQYEIDGKRVEFGRVYAEKYSGKRGGLEKTKDGNTTTYYTGCMSPDDEKGTTISATKFKTFIAETFGPNYQICSDIRHLAEMDWKKRREILFPLAPDVDKHAVLEMIPGLRDFLYIKNDAGDITGERSIEDAKTAADQRKKKIAEKVLEIPGLIKEHKTKLDNAGGITAQMADKAVSEAETAIGKAQIAIDQINQGDNSKTIAELKKLNGELLKAETEFQEEKTAAQVSESSRMSDINILNISIVNHNENLKDHQEAIQELRNQYAVIRDRKPDDGHPCVHYGEACPYHGQSVPEGIRTKSAEDFNKNKSDALEANQTRGGEMAAEIKRIKATIAEREAEKEKLEKITAPFLPYPESIDDLRAKIATIKNPDVETAKETPAELTQTLDAAKTRLTQAQEIRADIKAVSDSQTRIEELTAKKAELSAENDRVQKFLSLYDKFNQAMADAVEGPINSMFENVNFRMFKTQEDGQIVPACDVLDKEMRPYQGALSNGERIQAGLDMVRTMQKHYGISAPVWIDNSESVTGAIKLDSQFIELKANTKFSNLTKEI